MCRHGRAADHFCMVMFNTAREAAPRLSGTLRVMVFFFLKKMQEAGG